MSDPRAPQEHRSGPQPGHVLVVGAGILGAAVAREVTRAHPGARVTVLEKEDRAAVHQTGHNSGVVHAGLYYEPGGLKATLCRRGVRLLEEFAQEKNLPWSACGKLVVALDAQDESRLRGVHERAVANGVPGVELLGPEGIRAIEPEATGRAALHSPHTAITDYAAITRALLDDVRAAGGTVRYGTAVDRVTPAGDRAAVHATGDSGRERLLADLVIACTGLQSDRLARRSGAPQDPRIVPFFGQYRVLDPAWRNTVRGLVYPVPDPAYPFLGVHVTKRIDGETTVGPNAFLSLSREGYRGLGVKPRDAVAVGADPALWRFAARNLPAAWREARGVVRPQQFLAAAARYVPALADAGTVPDERGIRAQAMTGDGRLVDDFVIQRTGPVTHVRNAPSPGATSSLAIAEHVVAQALA